MDVLKGFLRRRRMNALFPFSVFALATLTVFLVMQPQSFEITMAATLAAIGLLEHILLMLPLPIEKLWHWSLSRKSKADHTHNSTHQRIAMGVLP
jgi:putative photosynthetic complex assembly protein 2